VALTGLKFQTTAPRSGVLFFCALARMVHGLRYIDSTKKTIEIELFEQGINGDSANLFTMKMDSLKRRCSLTGGMRSFL
jgi:hypothetical protein